MRLCRAAVIAWSVVAMPSAWAAQPLATDDAAVIPSKTCQLETWVNATHDGNAYWIQPACNFTDAMELSIGTARDRSAPEGPSSIVQLQAKVVPWPRGEGIGSFGITAGIARDTASSHGRSAYQSYYAKALASWYPRDDVEVDFNVGAANVYRVGTFVLAGAAVQYSIVADLQALAEIFRDEPGAPKYQVGARYIVIPNRFETYLSYGNTFNRPSSQSWVTVGIRLQTEPFLP